MVCWCSAASWMTARGGRSAKHWTSLVAARRHMAAMRRLDARAFSVVSITVAVQEGIFCLSNA